MLAECVRAVHQATRHRRWLTGCHGEAAFRDFKSTLQILLCLPYLAEAQLDNKRGCLRCRCHIQWESRARTNNVSEAFFVRLVVTGSVFPHHAELQQGHTNMSTHLHHKHYSASSWLLKIRLLWLAKESCSIGLVVLHLLNFMMQDQELHTLYRAELFDGASWLCSHTSSFWKTCAGYHSQCNGNVKGSNSSRR